MEDKFTHLHVHTQYSLLDGAASVEKLLNKAKEQNMEALAITDHGNMYGIAHFIEASRKKNIKPIIGCEFYLVDDRFDRENKERFHQILLVKNDIGYKNLSKLSSLSFIDGYYYKPRIDKEILERYSEGLIATTSCMAGQVNSEFLKGNTLQAEKLFAELYETFGSDFYAEVQRFGNEKQERCNQFLIKMAKKYGVKIIATNDVHYVNKEEAIAHDVLLCIQTNSDFYNENRMRFCADTFYLKSTKEMLEAFKDLPEAIFNTQEIVDKCWDPHIERDIMLPQYEVPENFKTQKDYLRYLTEEGAKKKFAEIDEKIKNRIDYELEMIHKMNFEGYFLIVQDYINAAKNLNVSVGPGRGSVAGSLVAYCIGITNVNPLQFCLFFERFLNPERISMPDIDVDFEDNGRNKVIDYVLKKYGEDKVARLITMSTMATKAVIKDVARVFGMPFEKSNNLTKLVPFKTTGSLAEMIETVPDLKALYNKKDSIEHKILSIASVLEGCKRQTGIHACGIIISPQNLIECIPIKTDKSIDTLITQYEGPYAEHVGMLKMDFLGLKTLTIIKNAVIFIKKHKNIDIDIDKIQLDDKETLKLFRSGNTIGVFQFESEGMRQWMKKLKPDNIDDIIAMNALYRPGPMQFIPDFIKRKHGEQEINYPNPLLKDILKNTYGIIVYQEQVMQVAQIVAGYSLGQADILRKAMGKKKPEEMAKQKIVFIEGCKKIHGIKEDEARAIFEMMETFAQYGFNKAHSTAYSIIAFQTAYLKAHYPVEFMTATLINAQTDITALTQMMQECKRMGIKIHGVSINDSSYDFDINNKNEICYGLSGVKGIGDAAAKNIMEARIKGGKFKDIFDFIERVDVRTINKKVLEALALSGGLDCLCNGNRRQYLYTVDNGMSFIEKLIDYGGKIYDVRQSLKKSLFGEIEDEDSFIEKPKIPDCQEYPQIELLQFEKDFIGFYISGHPLDKYKKCIDKVCNIDSRFFKNDTEGREEEVSSMCEKVDAEKVKKNAKIAGIITKCAIKISKNNTPFAIVTLEDFYGEFNFNIFGQTFLKNKNMIKKNKCILAIGKVTTKFDDTNKFDFKCDIIEDLGEINHRYEQIKK